MKEQSENPPEVSRVLLAKIGDLWQNVIRVTEQQVLSMMHQLYMC